MGELEYKIGIFTTKTCFFCKSLKKMLVDNELEYTEFDVEFNKDAYLKIANRTGTDEVPVILVNDKILIPKKSFENLSQAIELIKMIINKKYD